MKKIGIFGGSFDPVHLGHVALAEKIRRAHTLDFVYFVPVKRSPFKKNSPIASDRDRLKMLRLALGDKPKFKISSFELGRPAPSYTIYTVRHFRKKFPRAQLFLLMGRDAVRRIKKWKNWREILKLCGLVSLGRIGGISSTKIRKSISQGSKSKVLDPKVSKFILSRKLYAL